MTKLILCAFFYALALSSIYLAMQMAPDMKWPQTDIEYMAAELLIIGCVAKLAGHWTLLIAKFR